MRTFQYLFMKWHHINEVKILVMRLKKIQVEKKAPNGVVSCVHTVWAVPVAVPVPLRWRIHPVFIFWHYKDVRGPTMEIIFSLHNDLPVSALGKGSAAAKAAQVFPPLSDGRPSPVEKWVPWLLKGPTCQRSRGISHSQSPYCSPGHNRQHGGLALCHQLCCELLLGQQKCNTPVTMD